MKFRWGKKEKEKGRCSKLQGIIRQADLVDRKCQIKLNARQKESREKSIERERERERDREKERRGLKTVIEM
jgi:hypothetical protein